jgi:hypothetical protein
MLCPSCPYPKVKSSLAPPLQIWLDWLEEHIECLLCREIDVIEEIKEIRDSFLEDLNGKMRA